MLPFELSATVAVSVTKSPRFDEVGDSVIRVVVETVVPEEAWLTVSFVLISPAVLKLLSPP
jgi:hypothetical protein